MKNVFKSVILSLALVVSASAFAGELSENPNVVDLINSDNVVLYTYWGCLDDGYQMTSSTFDPIYYIAIPQGEHKEGTVTLTLNKRVGGPNSLATDYVFVKIDIIDNGQGDLSIGTMTVERMHVN